MNETMLCMQRGEIAIPGGAIYEDDLTYISHGQMESEGLTYPGGLFVEPKRHVASIADLGRAEAERIGWLISVASRGLMCESAERVYVEVAREVSA
jgi:histidine triad (HIT) family protein